MAELDPADLEAIRELLLAGDKLRALALYREKTGASIVQAKDYIVQLIERERIDVPPYRPPVQRQALTEEGLAAMRAALARGDVSAARGSYETSTGTPWYEAAGEIGELAKQWAAASPAPDELQDKVVAMCARPFYKRPTNLERVQLERRWPEELRIVAYARTLYLLDAATQVCDECRKHNHMDEKTAPALLQTRCPGFSTKAYAAACGYGFFTTMW